MKSQKTPAFGLLVVALLLASCADRNQLAWDADLLTPLAHGEVALADVVPDSLYEPTNGQGYASIVYSDTFTLYRLTDELVFSDTVARFPVRLDSLTLATDPIEERITLRQIAEQLAESRDQVQRAIGNTLLNNDGETINIPISASGLTAGPVPIDASDFFDEAIIQSGFLRLTIENRLPLDLSNVQFTVENGSGPPPIIEDQFDLIPAGSTATKDYDVSGQTIESLLNGGLTNIDIPAALNVLINLEDYIRIAIEPVDLKVERATAVFPGQTVVDDTTFSLYDFDEPYQDILLNKMVIASGKLEARSLSTIQDSILFTYTIPNANRNGEIPSVVLKIDPAQGGIPSEQVQSAILEGFTLDLTMGGERINAVQQRLIVDLVYSGKKVTIGLEDSLDVRFGLLDVEPTYIEGNLGEQTFTFSGEETIDLFDEIVADRMEATRPRLSLLLGNSFGLDAELDVQLLQARKASGEKVDLRGGSLRAGPLLLQGLELPDTFGIAYTRVDFDENSSNLGDIFSLLPETLEYDIKVRTNSGSSSVSFDDFATNESRFNVILEAEIPLEGRVENLQLIDTLEVDLSDSGDDLNEVKGGELRLLIDNEFPMEVVVSAEMVDARGQVLIVLAENSKVEAAELAPSEVRTTGAKRTLIPVDFDQNTLQNVINNATNVNIRYQIKTAPEGQNVRFYDNYRLKASVVGAFTYSIQ
jgi:hypothetical protein